LIFDVTYLYPLVAPDQPIALRFPATTTHVTIIENDGNTKHDGQYNGFFQVTGVGRYAVYALVNDYVASATPTQAPTFLRRLVALGPLFPTLPSVDVPFQAQVKVSAVGDDSALDAIAVVDNRPNPPILAPAETTMPSIPIRVRTVQMFQSDGKSFKAVTPT